MKIMKTQTVSADEAEKQLTEMLDTQTAPQAQTNDQLRRLQRALQGLPPLST